MRVDMCGKLTDPSYSLAVSRPTCFSLNFFFALMALATILIVISKMQTRYFLRESITLTTIHTPASRSFPAWLPDAAGCRHHVVALSRTSSITQTTL